MLAIDARTRLGALDLDASLDVAPGTCVALAGPSGAGKSTLLRVAAGLLRPAHGVVRCGEHTWLDTARGVDLAPERRRCGFVFQDYALFGHLRAWQNVAYPLRELPRRERRSRAHELLERFGLADRAGARPAELSGGERQRVALARALARRPAALLLDEPLSALDAPLRRALRDELRAILNDWRTAAVLVTHDFTEAFVADFTGAVVLTGTARSGERGLTVVELDGGGVVSSTDEVRGRVAATVHPWEIALEPPGAAAAGSARNRLAVDVVSVTVVGNRVRVGLAAPQPLAAEVTLASVDGLRVRPGERAVATWKAAATRLVQHS